MVLITVSDRYKAAGSPVNIFLHSLVCCSHQTRVFATRLSAVGVSAALVRLVARLSDDDRAQLNSFSSVVVMTGSSGMLLTIGP